MYLQDTVFVFADNPSVYKRGRGFMKKDRIFFPRTYRHFQVDSRQQALFVVLCIIPVLLLLLFFYPNLTEAISGWVIQLLRTGMPDVALFVGQSDFIPLFGSVHYVAGLPTVYPSFNFSMINLAAALILLWVCFSSKRRGKPLSIYFAMNLLIHLIACIYFAIVPTDFPYTATTYSDLYMKLQVAIWLSFIVIAGLATGLLMTQSVWLRLAAFFSILLYSLVFGFVRYLTFLYIIYAGSILYFPSLFLTLGPFFDFLYLVFLYSVFADIVIKQTSTNEGRSAWQWF